MVIRNSPVTMSLFVTSVLGFFVSVGFVSKFSETFAVAFALVFLVMFVSALLSLGRGFGEEDAI